MKQKYKKYFEEREARGFSFEIKSFNKALDKLFCPGLNGCCTKEDGSAVLFSADGKISIVASASTPAPAEATTSPAPQAGGCIIYKKGNRKPKPVATNNKKISGSKPDIYFGSDVKASYQYFNIGTVLYQFLKSQKYKGFTTRYASVRDFVTGDILLVSSYERKKLIGVGYEQLQVFDKTVFGHTVQFSFIRINKVAPKATVIDSKLGEMLKASLPSKGVR